jgi:hypothetical protein
MAAPISPTVSLALINQQRTFLDIAITTNVQGNIYYHLMRGNSMTPLSSSDLKVKIKNSELILQKMDDFLTHIYTKERD